MSFSSLLTLWAPTTICWTFIVLMKEHLEKITVENLSHCLIREKKRLDLPQVIRTMFTLNAELNKLFFLIKKRPQTSEKLQSISNFKAALTKCHAKLISYYFHFQYTHFSEPKKNTRSSSVYFRHRSHKRLYNCNKLHLGFALFRLIVIHCTVTTQLY